MRSRTASGVAVGTTGYVQKGAGAAGVEIPGGVFGKTKGWAEKLADEEALLGMRSSAAGLATAHLPYVLPQNTSGSLAGSVAKLSKPPSPVDGSQVKFVNSTVENLQSQIKKEEAPKKKRTRTSPEQLRILQKAFASDPMPSSAARLALSKKLGMNARAVQVWFQNRRAKAKRAEQLGLSGTGYEDDEGSLMGSEDDGCLEEEDSRPAKKGNLGMSRTQSMSAVAAGGSGYSEMYGIQPNQAAFFGLDAAGFMEQMEPVSFEGGDGSAAALMPGLDFGVYGGLYGTYGQPVPQMHGGMHHGGMFSLPPNSYDAPAELGVPPQPLRYGGGAGGAAPYPSFNDELVTDFASPGTCDLGPINPLSALMDPLHQHQLQAQHQMQQQLMDHTAYGNTYGSACGSAYGSARRSYSLNDIHAQLTTQQIQTLENIGLPNLVQTKVLGPISEEEGDPVLELAAASSKAGAHLEFQDQLLSTIDDLHMGNFWESQK